MKRLTLGLIWLSAWVVLSADTSFAASLVPNTLTTEEVAQGWTLLWDGKTSTGWRSARRPQFPEQGWSMKEGVLTVLGSGGVEGGKGGDIITLRKYASFELLVDFKITAGANSGIKYFVDPELNKGPGSSIGLEYQILDDAHHPDAKLGKNGNRTLASLYDLIPAAASKKPNPVGAWNTARLVIRGAHGEHWLNGEKVVEYERFTPEFRKLVAESKYQHWPNFGEWKEGYILFQDHGNEVSFRNLKIRDLAATPTPKELP
jgi:hypothetical protein